ALIVAINLRPFRAGDTRAPFHPAGASDIHSLSFLARTSVRQQEELDQARDERLRAEEEARARLVALNHALEEKVRIGRDLHDGVIQSLYAAGLTLQTVREMLESNPAAA